MSEIALIGKCQKLLGLESVRICSDRKVSEAADHGKCQNWEVSETAEMGMS